MKSNIHDILVFVFFLGVLLVPLLLGLFLSLQIEHGLTRARQTFLRLLKIGLFLALSVFAVVLLGNTLRMFLV